MIFIFPLRAPLSRFFILEVEAFSMLICLGFFDEFRRENLQCLDGKENLPNVVKTKHRKFNQMFVK